ncbi:MAG: hypothetical protein HQ474_09520 [Flammeovirgaceae bacterium]|nr:hypothetical protein [Flammeovirgaceae bacterium]
MQICASLEIHLLIIRSDNANSNTRINFKEFVEVAFDNSARLVLGILERLDK